MAAFKPFPRQEKGGNDFIVFNKRKQLKIYFKEGTTSHKINRILKRRGRMTYGVIWGLAPLGL